MRLPTTLTWLAIVAVGVAGCGKEVGGPKATTQPESETNTVTKPAPVPSDKPIRTGGEVKVEMRDIKMVPAKIDVKVGQTVRWTNEDPVTHTATARSGATFDSGNIAAGKSYSWKATEPGTVEYYCTIHGPQQSGTLNVKQ
jgi:plastocyanin